MAVGCRGEDQLGLEEAAARNSSRSSGACCMVTSSSMPLARLVLTPPPPFAISPPPGSLSPTPMRPAGAYEGDPIGIGGSTTKAIKAPSGRIHDEPRTEAEGEEV